MATAEPRAHLQPWAVTGAVAGIIAGIIFAMFEMIMAAIMGMGFFMPFRMIGGILLGEQALEPGYSLLTAGGAGLVVHMMLSAIYGVIFGVIVANINALRGSWLAMIVAGAVFGLLLWIVNFYVIAPVAFPWFQNADPVVQFLAHTFFFGALLGLLMAYRLVPRSTGQSS